jgi:hypothetical protein
MSDHTYYMDDCTLAVPAGFVDRTMNALEWPLEGGDRLGLVVQRERLPPDPADPAALDRYVAAQVKAYPAQFAGFHLERDEAADSDSAYDLRRKTFRWRHEQGVLYHHQIFVRVGASVLVLTATAKARHREAVDRLVDEALAGLRARGEDDRG